jgi:hypothetical protein
VIEAEDEVDDELEVMDEVREELALSKIDEELAGTQATTSAEKIKIGK